MTIDRWIVDAKARTPERPALISPGKCLTYSEMATEVDARSTALAAAGVGHGDRVAWYGLNNPEVLVLLFACARLGAILVPLNWRLTDNEVAAIVSQCQPRLVIHDRHFGDRARKLPDSPAVSMDQPLPSGTPARSHAASEEDPLLLVYTSGSTGNPKGVVLTQRALVCNAAMSVEAHGLRSEDRVFNVLPLFHVGGLNILSTPALSIGAAVVLQERFDPDAACATFEEVTHAITVPTILKAIIGSKGWSGADLRGLRAVSIGSADVPASLIETMHARGVPVIQIYGATETCPLAIYQSAGEAVETVGSIGRAGSGCAIRLVRDGADVPDGEPGEIWVRGDNVLREYWQNPELTAEQLQDGWFRTGDIAKRDGNGLYWFVDRIKHVIISGGENVYPAEIERRLAEVPGIVEAAVVGCPDPKWGETPVAVVVARGTPSEEAVLAPLRSRLARYKMPSAVVFAEALPRNAMGKVVIAEVRAMAANREPDLSR